MAKPNKPATQQPTTSSAPTTTVEKKDAKKPAKTTMAQAKVLLAAGIITQEKLDEMVKLGLVTDGTGGGEDVMKQFAAAGVPQADIDALEAALKKVNDALWKDSKTYIGKEVQHSFSKKDETTGVKSTYEAPAQIEAALWCKHFEVKKS